MTYQVLARKWRPRNFEQMVGQDHVLRTLINALNQGRLHHAYLFSGTRGVGKTTLGRVLAKCLNCEHGVSARPCGECSACREIDEGRFVDLIEVDAASRTKVEDTRELLENVHYSPARGRYKVYLIDEVHMLSGHSFNALLKTLEEPPPHVKFLLATTDPQRLPMTVLSRCLQFNLKRMSVQQIAAHLRYMLEQEKIAADDGALVELARAADGSMRDALSLLDQAIGFGGGEVRETGVREMLGAAPREYMYELASALADGDTAAVLRAVGNLVEYVTDVSDVLVELISLLHQVALAQSLPGGINAGYPYATLAEELSRKLSPQDVQLYYQIALVGRRDLPLAADPRAGLEMVLMRMLSFRPLTQTERSAVLYVSPAVQAGAGGRGVSPPKSGLVEPETTSQPHDRSSTTVLGQDWSRLLQALQLKGVALALASNCSLRSLTQDEVRLVLDARHAEIRAGNAEARLRQALCDYMGQNINLRIEIADHANETPAQLAARSQVARQREAETAIDEDATVCALKEHLDAEVIPGSIRPITD